MGTINKQHKLDKNRGCSKRPHNLTRNSVLFNSTNVTTIQEATKQEPKFTLPINHF